MLPEAKLPVGGVGVVFGVSVSVDIWRIDDGTALLATDGMGWTHCLSALQPVENTDLEGLSAMILSVAGRGGEDAVRKGRGALDLNSI